MKQTNIITRTILGAFIVLAAAAPGGAALRANAANPAQRLTAMAGAGGDLRAFQLVSPGAGWALMGQQLYWTDTGGADWRDLTPPGLGATSIQAASFTDGAHGWVLSTAASLSGDMSYGLARTVDGGRTWQSQTLALFAPGEAAGMAGDVSLQFIDPRIGWLVVKQATSSNFDLGTLFRTDDSGDGWTRLSLPTGELVHFTSALDGEQDASAVGRGSFATHDGGQTWTEQPETALSNAPAGPGGSRLSAMSMATLQDGWASTSQGNCASGSCRLVTRLLATHDGGQTWAPLSLPDGQSALEQTFARPSAAAPTQTADGLRVAYQGPGFDFCDPKNGLPTLADMLTWYIDSPYRVWGLYLGGSSNHGLCGTLTKLYVQQLAQEGWLFIPTWVGPQAPCSNYLHKMDADPNIARSEGVAEADLARNVASSLGLTLSDLSGTVIYYDVEYYNNSPDTTCLAAVQAFISGWSGELRASGIKAGVYGAPCGQSLSAFAGIPNVPDYLWIARWTDTNFNPSASVFGSTICGLDNSLWVNHQRMRQYAGGHNETWGNVTFNIDSDVIDANVATVQVNCGPTWGQVGLFQYPFFGGQCVLKSLGDYPTAASLGLPFQPIASLRVGATMTATLCQGEFFAPACQAFTTDVSDLSTEPVGANQISSIRIATSLVMTNHLYIPTALLAWSTP